MHASIPSTHVSSLSSGFLYSSFSFFFFYFFVCSTFFSFFLSLFFFFAFVPPSSPLFSLFTTMTLYTACRDRIYHFYPSTAFGSLWASFQDYLLTCRLPSHYHYIVLAAPRLIPKQKWFCSVSYLS